MKYLIYLSTATELMDESDLLSLLQVSRFKNQKNELTGMLLYSEGTFIQLLEGEPEKVSNTYESILKDQRHKNIIKIAEGDSPERQFPEWSMGFKSANADEMAEFEGYVDARHSRELQNADAQPLVRMLKIFADSNRM